MTHLIFPDGARSILGLDCSSTCIGHAALHAGQPVRYGHIDLTGDIAHRCAQANDVVADLLDVHKPLLVVIESPVARFAKAVIPQARVSGSILALFHQRGTLWQEVAPSVAKRALAGDGAAMKKEMVAAACNLMGLVGYTIATMKGKVTAVVGPHCLLNEDEADAIALALVGSSLRVVTVSAAA